MAKKYTLVPKKTKFGKTTKRHLFCNKLTSFYQKIPKYQIRGSGNYISIM